jgi:hypothetical protein
LHFHLFSLCYLLFIFIYIYSVYSFIYYICCYCYYYFYYFILVLFLFILSVSTERSFGFYLKILLLFQGSRRHRLGYPPLPCLSRLRIPSPPPTPLSASILNQFVPCFLFFLSSHARQKPHLRINSPSHYTSAPSFTDHIFSAINQSSPPSPVKPIKP